ncbi:MAG: efflux RND transporter permease subunit [Verrucomicrobia bacterium]|nr:efflux RND transporter permease subunit [Verrucomicrobiota bacterium]
MRTGIEPRRRAAPRTTLPSRAILGALPSHILLGVTPSYLSVFGMPALAGVALDNSIVLVGYVNQRRAAGRTLREAALEAGARRFRPILLTSATTLAGLAPLMLAKSLQAQFLIPTAVSLGFGIVLGTVITLLLVLCALRVADDVGATWRGLTAQQYQIKLNIHGALNTAIERPV